MRLHPHPDGDHPAEGRGENRKKRPDRQHGKDRLSGGPLGHPGVLGPAGPGDDGQKSHAESGDGGVDQPSHRTGGSHRRRGLRAKGSHHGRVDVLHRGLAHLLQHRGPGQVQNHPDHGPGLAFLLNHIHFSPPNAGFPYQLYHSAVLRDLQTSFFHFNHTSNRVV